MPVLLRLVRSWVLAGGGGNQPGLVQWRRRERPPGCGWLLPTPSPNGPWRLTSRGIDGLGGEPPRVKRAARFGPSLTRRSGQAGVARAGRGRGRRGGRRRHPLRAKCPGGVVVSGWVVLTLKRDRGVDAYKVVRGGKDRRRTGGPAVGLEGADVLNLSPGERVAEGQRHIDIGEASAYPADTGGSRNPDLPPSRAGRHPGSRGRRRSRFPRSPHRCRPRPQGTCASRSGCSSRSCRQEAGSTTARLPGQNRWW